MLLPGLLPQTSNLSAVWLNFLKYKADNYSTYFKGGWWESSEIIHAKCFEQYLGKALTELWPSLWSSHLCCLLVGTKHSKRWWPGKQPWRQILSWLSCIKWITGTCKVFRSGPDTYLTVIFTSCFLDQFYQFGGLIASLIGADCLTTLYIPDWRLW